MKNLRIGLLFLLTLSAAVSGCRMLTESSTSSSGGSGGGSGQSVESQSREGSSSDPQSVIQAALKNVEQQKSWSAIIETENESMPQASSKMNMYYSAPDNFRMVTDAGKMSTEIILAGNETYLNFNGKWQKLPSDKSDGNSMKEMRKKISDINPDTFRNVQSLGNETVNGQETAVYSYETATPSGLSAKEKNGDGGSKQSPTEQKFESKSKIYIDKSKNLPVKVETQLKMPPPINGEQKMIMTYDFTTPVTIEKPEIK